mmetsp:Transcript_31683/g.100630  ORF Transcript_31683/g.100630 Transcript_31683/m.100630 type:complete len:248 (+) Transcript_31683:148-891(+)
MAVGAALAAMVPRWERGYRQAGVETPETPYLELALIFATAIWIWETYLSVRQYRRIRALEGRVPDELEDTVAATGGGSDNISALGDEHKTPQKAPRRNTTNTAVDLSQADVDELLAVIGYHRLMHEVAARNLGAESKKKEGSPQGPAAAPAGEQLRHGGGCGGDRRGRGDQGRQDHFRRERGGCAIPELERSPVAGSSSWSEVTVPEAGRPRGCGSIAPVPVDHRIRRRDGRGAGRGSIGRLAGCPN